MSIAWVQCENPGYANFPQSPSPMAPQSTMLIEYVVRTSKICARPAFLVDVTMVAWARLVPHMADWIESTSAFQDVLNRFHYLLEIKCFPERSGHAKSFGGSEQVARSTSVAGDRYDLGIGKLCRISIMRSGPFMPGISRSVMTRSVGAA